MSAPDEPADSETATVTALPGADEGGRVIAAPPRIGRYEIERVLGTGGMGIVYAATDPTLARQVALKVIRGSRGDQQRLVREAQAIARVSHANVVSVFDAGIDAERRVFIAMELVDGDTLAAWLTASPRTVEEVVAVFQAAGRGLAAAHAAGLVHRDFKPANVIVGKDGVARVLDFGVAQADTDGPDGAVVGTPHYMSPEQWTGAGVDARSDQFSFCVALYRALCDELPYGEIERSPAPTSWERRPWPRPAAGRVVPARVRAAIDRGLSRDPADRFPSMNALLAEIDDPLGRKRRRRLLAVAGVLVVGAVSAAAAVALVDRTPRAAAIDPCAATTDRFAGIWDDATRSEVRAAFEKSGVSYAGTAFAQVAAILDRRRAAWESTRRQSCEATRVRGVQSDAALDLRAACLERRATEVEELVGLLRNADAAVVQHAVTATDATGDVSVCDDATALARRAPLPADPAARTAIAALERDLARARAQLESGTPVPVVAAAATLLERATAIGYAPLIAEVAYLRGDVALDTADRDAALAAYQRGGLAAEEGGDDRLRFDIEIRLVAVEGQLFERERGCQEHLDRAAALHKRLGPDPSREARLASHRGHVDLWFGRSDQARAHLAAAVAALEGRPGDRLLQSRILYRLGVAHADSADPRAAADAYARALAIQVELLGDAHPTVARTLMNRGDVLLDLGQTQEATEDVKRARAIYEASVGPRSPLLGDADVNLASNLIDSGDPAAAVAPARSAIAIYDATLGPESSKAGWAHGMLATALAKTGQREEADREFTRALAIITKVSGPSGRQAQAIRLQHATFVRRTGDHRRARDLSAALVRDTEQAAGATSATLIDPLKELGENELALRRYEAAVSTFERAYEIQLASPRGPYDQARVALALATALRALGRDPARVQTLAAEAKAGFATSGQRGAEGLAEAEALVQAVGAPAPP